MDAAAAVAGRDIRRQVRRPGTLVGNAFQVVFFALIYAVGVDSTVGTVDGLPFSAFVLPGLMAIQVASIGISTGVTYAWDREYGVLREIVVAPVSRMCLPVGKAAGTTVIVVVQCALLLVAAPLFGVRPSLSGIAATLGVAVLGAIVFSGAGLLLASTIRRVQTLSTAVQMAMLPMLFLSGSVFRPDVVPSWLAAVITLNPLTYLVDLTRHVLVGSATTISSEGVDLLLLGAIGVVAAVVVRLRAGR